jgi:hypothetical protein
VGATVTGTPAPTAAVRDTKFARTSTGDVTDQPDDRPGGHTRRAALAAAGTLVATAGCLGSLGGGSGGGDGDTTADAWRTTALTDVRSGEAFTVADLDPPVLVETFAVWCSTCLAQQRAMRTLHERRPAVTSVTLNVDPNEDAGRVRSHLAEHGFDWRYAVSPPAVTESLVSQFGSSMTVPPRAPVVLVCGDGATRLGDGVKSADRLAAAVDGCNSA